MDYSNREAEQFTFILAEVTIASYQIFAMNGVDLSLQIYKTSSNRSPNIFTLVQKVKHRVYKIHAFLNEAMLWRDSAK